MNTKLNSSQTVDERCAEHSRHAFYCAQQLHLGVAGENTLYGMRIRIPALADRIIAERERERAALDIAERTREAEQGAQAGGTRTDS